MEDLDYYVYHIGIKGMSIDEGYIGVTNKPDRRWSQHCKSDSYVGRAIRKYGEIVSMVILKQTTEQRALEIEEVYRPQENQGWNIAKGGGKPPRLFGKANPHYRTGPPMTDKRKEYYNSDKIKSHILNVRHKKARLGTGADYKITHAETGEEFIITSGIKEWCKQRGLECSNIKKVADGLRKQHKGYKAEYI